MEEGGGRRRKTGVGVCVCRGEILGFAVNKAKRPIRRDTAHLSILLDQYDIDLDV